MFYFMSIIKKTKNLCFSSQFNTENMQSVKNQSKHSKIQELLLINYLNYMRILRVFLGFTLYLSIIRTVNSSIKIMNFY